MTELPIKATLKAGKDYDAPWITVDGADPADLAFKLNGLAEAGALQAVVDAANLLKAANVVSSSGATGTAPSAPAAPAQQAPAPAQPQGWGAGQPQQQAPQQSAPPSWALGQCESCGKPLERKATGNGKPVDRCPDWRWNSGNPNGHTNNFV